MCAVQYTLWKEMVEKVETEKGYHKGFVNRVEQLKKEYEDNILLYNNIRSQRNRILRAVEVSIMTQFKVTHTQNRPFPKCVLYLDLSKKLLLDDILCISRLGTHLGKERFEVCLPKIGKILGTRR